MAEVDGKLKEEELIRQRDEKRRKEEEERKKRAELDRQAEEKRMREEQQRILEEERRRKRVEEELAKLGSDVIVPLPPAPPSFIDDTDPSAMKSWFLDDESSKPIYRTASLKKGRKMDAPKVTFQMLREVGVVYFKINLNDFAVINRIVKERCYKHMDEIRISQTCKDEQFLEKWFQEHFDDDEQIRLVTDGSVFFDVRSKQDTWIRCHLQAGDCIVLPAGLCHRGTLDENDYCAMVRLFRDAHRWAPFFRSEKKNDSNQTRLQYLKWLKKGSVAAEMGFK